MIETMTFTRRGLAWTVLGTTVLLLAAYAYVRLTPEASDPVRYRGRLDTTKTYDGDTFWLIGQTEKFRLWGIDAVESKQECTRYDTGKTWRCGQEATNALRDLVQSDQVECDRHSYDRMYRRVIVVCRVRGIEINAWLVDHGWALAYTSYTKHYLAAQNRAEANRVGIWSGQFIKPWEWRRDRLRR
jgi:endonuclease YncB( thermonuclease family)